MKFIFILKKYTLSARLYIKKELITFKETYKKTNQLISWYQISEWLNINIHFKASSSIMENSINNNEQYKIRKTAENLVSLEEDKACTELINILMKTSTNFKKGYYNIAKQLQESLTFWKEYDYNQDISTLIEQTQKDGTQIQRIGNLMKGYRYLWEGDKQMSKYFCSVKEEEIATEKLWKPFTKYAESFIRTYFACAYDFMKTTWKIPTITPVLKKTFLKISRRYITDQIKKLEFSEENYKECFNEIQWLLEENGVILEPSNNIQESFIKLCRETYPLAKPYCDQLFENKSFRKKFLEKEVNSWINQTTEKFFDSIVKLVDDYIAQHPEDVWEQWRNGIITDNIIFNYNNLREESLWEDMILANYFLEIVNTFKQEHNRKLAAQKKKAEKNVIQDEIPIVNLWENSLQFLSKEDEENINKAISYFNCDDKKKKSIKKFFRKLLIKWLPRKINEFKKIFEIENIPAWTENILIDILGIEYVNEKENKDNNEESPIKIQENTQDEQINTQENKEIIIEDPITSFLERIEGNWYTIPNKPLLTEQIENFCKNWNNKTVLTNLLKNQSFWGLLFHRNWHKKARILPIWRTGRRLLLIKDSWATEVDGFYNHNDYEFNLAKIKN